MPRVPQVCRPGETYLMRCAICGHENEPGAVHCSSCGVGLDPKLHDELSSIKYLLEELRTWERRGEVSRRLRLRLEAKYKRRKRDITGTLTSRLLEVVKEETREAEPAAEVPAKKPVKPVSYMEWILHHRKTKPAVEKKRRREPEVRVEDASFVAREKRDIPKRETVEAAPAGAKPLPKRQAEEAAPAVQKDFKYYFRRLFSDRNIRILQQIGIFVFIAGVIAFITSQWTTWSSLWKMLSMCLSTAGFFVGGSVLRKKTILRWTGISVTMLGTLFIPITCYMGIHHGIFTGEPGAYWIVACVVSIAVNGFLARVLSEEVFVYFAWVALYGLVTALAKTIGVSYEGLVPYVAAVSLVLLLLRPTVESAESRIGGLEISYSRPLEILVNVCALAVLVAWFILLCVDIYALREHFLRYFSTLVFLAIFCIHAARTRKQVFYLFFACGLKIAGFAIWVYAFEIAANVAIPLLMTIGVSFYAIELVLTRLGKTRFALPYVVIGKMIRAVALIAAAGTFLGKGDVADLDTLILTLGQFVGLCTAAVLHKPTKGDAIWTLGAVGAWLFVFLCYLKTGWHNFPVYYLLLGAAARVLASKTRETRYGILSVPLRIFTQVVGITAAVGVAVAYFHYWQREIGHGLLNVSVAAVFAFYVGVAERRVEWLSTVFVALAGLLLLALHNAGVSHLSYPAFLGMLASAAVLLTVKGIVYDRDIIVSIMPFKKPSPDWAELRRLMSLPGLAGSLAVASISLVLLIVSYARDFDRELLLCITWRECLVGIASLGAYCVVGALCSRRDEFERAALGFFTAGYLLVLQSFRVSVSHFAWAAALHCVFVVFVGLLFSFLKKKFMTRTALEHGLALTGAAVLAMLFNPQSYEKPNLLAPALVLAVGAAVFCYFSLRRQEIVRTSPEWFTYAWGAFAVTAYGFFFVWTPTQIVRDLYTVPAGAVLLAVSVLLRSRQFERQHAALWHISYAAALVPFIIMLAQVDRLGSISPDTHMTLITVLSAVCAYHVAAAALIRYEWLEFAGIGFGYLAYVTFLIKFNVGMPRFGLFALPVVFTVFLAGMVFCRLKKRLFARSTFLSSLVLLGVSVIIPLFHADSYENTQLPYIFSTILIASGTACYFALRRFALFEKEANLFSYAYGILLVAGYSFFVFWSDVQFVRDLYTVPAAAGLLACAVLLRKRQFHRQYAPVWRVSYGAAVLPFLFILIQASGPGNLSPDIHLTFITVLLAVCAYHVAAAAAWRREWTEYPAIAAGYLGYVTVLLKHDIGVSRFGLLALPAVFAVFLAGMISRRHGEKFFARSPFLCGLVLLGVSVAVPMFARASYDEANLPFVFGTWLLAAGIMCYFSLRRFALFDRAATPFSYAFAILLCVGHALFLQWLSTGTPLAGLYFLQVSVLLAVVAWLLKMTGFERQWKAPCYVGFAATGVSMYLAISRSDLTATLVFVGCSVLYGFFQRITGRRFFLWAATVSFSTSYFFALRHLDVEPVQYLLWFSVLAATQVAFSVAMARTKEIATTPIFVIGLLISFSTMVVMIALGGRYFSANIDTAIASTLIAAGTYFLSARRAKSIFFYYLSSLTALGAYYLLLHKYEVSMTEFFTLPVAGLVLAAATVHLRHGLENRLANWAYVLGCGALLAPSMIRSAWISHLDSCLVAYVLAFGCILAAMMFRRKVVFGAGATAIIYETVLKLVHFVVQRHLSKAQVVMIVGIAIFVFAASLELIRNRRLREKAGLTRKRMKDFFVDWS